MKGQVKMVPFIFRKVSIKKENKNLKQRYHCKSGQLTVSKGRRAERKRKKKKESSDIPELNRNFSKRVSDNFCLVRCSIKNRIWGQINLGNATFTSHLETHRAQKYSEILGSLAVNTLVFTQNSKLPSNTGAKPTSPSGSCVCVCFLFIRLPFL